jgi:hypothetical protein
MELAFEAFGYLALFSILGAMLYAFYWFFSYMLKGIKKNDEYED